MTPIETDAVRRVDAATIDAHIAEARRLRAEALRELVTGLFRRSKPAETGRLADGTC